MHTLQQEIEVWYIIPAIRREMAVCFSQAHEISYGNIAFMMGLTKTAISLYVAGKRTEMIRMHPKALEEVKHSCQRIVKQKSTVIKEISRVLEIIKNKKLHCELCGKMIDGELHDCQEIKIPEAVI
jgi:predicted transcriptional regulator